MAKRFTDSEKFRNSWYRRLTPKQKCIWEYMISECSLAGIIEIDIESMGFHIGENITKDDIRYFQEKYVVLEKEKLFIPSFIRFQQKELNIKQKAHEKIINELQKYDIPLTVSECGFRYTIDTPLKGYQRCTSNSIGNGIGIGSSIVNKNNEEVTENKKNKLKKPENVTSETWQDFLTLRKAKKAPVTETVIKKIENEAAKIDWSLEQAMQEMCAQGWQGFKSEWIINRRKENGNGKSNQQIVDDIAEEYIRQLEQDKDQVNIKPGEADLRYIQ